MTITTGSRFGQYEITAPLGKGGMGEVYLARDIRLERQVALKILPLEFTQSTDRLRRFEQEAKTASALNHPNILTIHEIGAHHGTHFITTEFIAGQTLRDRLQQPLSPNEAAEIAIQIANALAAAHEANIIHRDIKPENVMLRNDGLVKVLDFGLAKLAEERRGDTMRRGEEDSTLELSPGPSHTTEAGTVLGTASYMSPEQARGEKVDARTDIFSLGVVLYEMLAGQRPFEGVNMLDVIGAVLHQNPAPLANVPAALQRIVTQALQKDRTQRYATVQDLQADLRAWQRQVEFDAEAHRRTLGAHAARVPASVSDPAQCSESPSQALARGPRALPGLRTSLFAVAVLLGVVVAAYFLLNRKAAPAFAEREPLLLADFENKTGEDIWDGTLKQALAVALEQSPYMNIFPEERARDTLRLMNRSVDEPITRATGREICQRRNVRAILIGTITKLERSYTVTLEATNAQSGETIARALEQASGRDDVVNALERAAKDLRGKLGESLASLQKYDVPLLEATTSSLEALKAYSTGWQEYQRGRNSEAISLYRRAIEVDEQFALARVLLAGRLFVNGGVSEGVEHLEKAWQRREKVSECERLRINSVYYQYGTGELDRAIEEALILTRTYPQDSRGFNHLATSYLFAGQIRKSEEAFRESFRLQPADHTQLINIARTLALQDRNDEAKEVYEQALKNIPDVAAVHLGLARSAIAQNKADDLNHYLEWFATKPSLFTGYLLQARIKAAAGRRRQANEFYQQAAKLEGARNQLENQVGLLSEGAFVNALFGQTSNINEETARALSIQRNSSQLLKGHFSGAWVKTFVGWVFALGGDATRAQLLTDELLRENPKDTLILSVIAPLTQATIELQRSNPAKAIELLQPVIPYEAAPASSFRPNWIRGQAYLQLKQGAQAAAEFQKIIDHRGWDVTSPLWPLAHLGLARAAVLQGDTAKAKQRYDEFFRLWKEADADLPVLIEAKKEYERLR